MQYECIAGLETHIELATKTKIFCGCTTKFGGEPNTRCCPVCTGMPGALPRLNRRVIEYAVLAGLATHCTVRLASRMARKNYSYPDLPKAYQITQHDRPLCENGYLTLDSGQRVRIRRIHIEEDAGKLIHEGGRTRIDYNRAGVPLIEVVTEPDLRSAQEAREFVEKLRRLARCLGISDCRMQEGSLRCDVNLSVRPAGSETPGVRTEIKNMNSLAHLERAMTYEWERQIRLLERGEPVAQETLRYNEREGTTAPMRGKEDARDYRYFCEPDLPEIRIPARWVEEWRAALPELPEERLERYRAMGLPDAAAQQLCEYRRVGEYFDQAAKGVGNPREVANCILGPFFAALGGEDEKEAFGVPVPPEELRRLVLLLESGRLPRAVLKKTLEQMLASGRPASDFLREEDLQRLSGEELARACRAAVQANPGAANDVRAGKKKAIQALVGAVMRETRGRASAREAGELLAEMLRETPGVCEKC